MEGLFSEVRRSKREFSGRNLLPRTQAALGEVLYRAPRPLYCAWVALLSYPVNGAALFESVFLMYKPRRRVT